MFKRVTPRLAQCRSAAFAMGGCARRERRFDLEQSAAGTFAKRPLAPPPWAAASFTTRLGGRRGPGRKHDRDLVGDLSERRARGRDLALDTGRRWELRYVEATHIDRRPFLERHGGLSKEQQFAVTIQIEPLHLKLDSRIGG